MSLLLTSNIQRPQNRNTSLHSKVVAFIKQHGLFDMPHRLVVRPVAARNANNDDSIVNGPEQSSPTLSVNTNVKWAVDEAIAMLAGVVAYCATLSKSYQHSEFVPSMMPFAFPLINWPAGTTGRTASSCKDKYLSLRAKYVRRYVRTCSNNEWRIVGCSFPFTAVLTYSFLRDDWERRQCFEACQRSHTS